MPPIGISTGWLHAKGMGFDLVEMARLFKEIGADGIEVVMTQDPTMLSWPQSPLSEQFEYVSVHFPDFDYIARERDHLSPEHKKQLQDMAKIMQYHHAQVGVLHPSFVPFYLYEILQFQHIPFAIENMDPHKDIGCSVADIEHLMNIFSAPGILDLEHAYQCQKGYQCNGKNLGIQFADMMATPPRRLAHLHVSGESGPHDHTLLIHAENQKEILSDLNEILSRAPVPIVLEGDPLPDVPEGSTFSEKERMHLLQKAAECLTKEIQLLRTQLHTLK
ncbi:hypothetical protein HYZ98_04410 [Candidatus Peregrinibacteria bacterium]|nr:hypothetical protein [Candidatus Peregrinibacteria bacterium]